MRRDGTRIRRIVSYSTSSVASSIFSRTVNCIISCLPSVILIVLLAACTTPAAPAAPPSSPSAVFLEQKGYRIKSYEGRAYSYELTKEKITALPEMILWGLQASEPDPYFGKTIDVQKYIVTGHPLAEGKVEVYVYEADGKPVGGNAHPLYEPSEAAPDGGYWSLEGKSLEEVQPLPFQQWREAWLKKYQ